MICILLLIANSPYFFMPNKFIPNGKLCITPTIAIFNLRRWHIELFAAHGHSLSLSFYLFMLSAHRLSFFQSVKNARLVIFVLWLRWMWSRWYVSLLNGIWTRCSWLRRCYIHLAVFLLHHWQTNWWKYIWKTIFK